MDNLSDRASLDFSPLPFSLRPRALSPERADASGEPLSSGDFPAEFSAQKRTDRSALCLCQARGFHRFAKRRRALLAQEGEATSRQTTARASRTPTVYKCSVRTNNRRHHRGVHDQASGNVTYAIVSSFKAIVGQCLKQVSLNFLWPCTPSTFRQTSMHLYNFLRHKGRVK